ncbi:Universal stress protein [Gossypium australe]|uniref:Universal stress protein n=1 Tax=Gossypium australe TaxID=47621 RepID=A0A5B6VZS5_9ROSI|nr:Universal stress protein [Gossypium australe]
MSSFGFWKSSSTNCSSLSSTDSDGFCALFGYSSSRYFKARKARNLSNFPTIRHKAKAVPQPQDSELSLVADALTHFKHLLLPITDRNPYLSEGTRQAAATTAALSKNYGADITVVGGFKEFKLLERLGEGSKATAIIAEVADDLNLYLVVMSMEAIRSKHVDANLLVEFIPCPVLFLPL